MLRTYYGKEDSYRKSDFPLTTLGKIVTISYVRDYVKDLINYSYLQPSLASRA